MIGSPRVGGDCLLVPSRSSGALEPPPGVGLSTGTWRVGSSVSRGDEPPSAADSASARACSLADTGLGLEGLPAPPAGRLTTGEGAKAGPAAVPGRLGLPGRGGTSPG